MNPTTSLFTKNRTARHGLFVVFAALPLSLVFSQAGGPDAFWGKFVAEIPNGDSASLVSLVRKSEVDVPWALVAKAQAFSVNNNAELGSQIEKLIATWKEAFKNNFLDKYYEDLRTLDTGQWNEWHRTVGRRRAIVVGDEKRRKGELNDEQLDKFGAEAAEIAGVFETLGDRYLASDCYFWAGIAFDPDQRPKGFDLQRCVENYEKMTKLREALDYKDRFYTDVAALVEKHKATLKKGGPPKPVEPKEKEKEKDKKPGGPSSTGDLFAKNSTWAAADAKFQMAPPEDPIERPSWNSDSNYIDWLALTVDGKPSPTLGANLPFFSASKEAKFIREDNAKYLFDPGDKNLVPLKLGRPMTFEFKMAGGIEYAMTAAIGSNQESFHGSTVNYSPSETKAPILYTSSASRLVELAGQKIRIFDDNCDGKFGSDPLVLKDYKGQMIGGFPFFDAMLLPGAKKAVPFSGFVKLGAKWHRLKSDSEGLGKKFQVRELDIKTGTLKVVWNGPANWKPHYLMVTETTEFTGAYFDLLSGTDKGIEVPAGEYQFVFGMYRSGKGRNMQKYAIVAPDSPKKYKVDAGQTVTIQLGGPFTFAHKATMDSSDINIPGKSIEIRGGPGGERYVLLSDETPRPKVEWRKPGAKSGTGLGEMKRIELKSGENPDVLLWPADLKLKRPDPGPLEFRLIDEHKWFGPVATDWIK